MLNTQTDRKCFCLHRHLLLQQHFIRVPCTVPDGEDKHVSRNLLPAHGRFDRNRADPVIFDFKISQAGFKVKGTAQPDNFFPHVFQNAGQHVRTDMRLIHI